MTPDKNFILPGINFLLIVSLFIYVFAGRNAADVVYVDNNRLFNEFAMSKEMKRFGDASIRKQTAKLDSLQIQFDIKNDSGTMRQIIMMQDSIRLFRDRFATEESMKIWTRIKTYTAQFAEKKEYQIIMGAQNAGEILYGSDKLDVTAELLIFLNKKYEGVE